MSKKLQQKEHIELMHKYFFFLLKAFINFFALLYNKTENSTVKQHFRNEE